MSKPIISIKGCIGNNLDGLYGFVLGVYMGNCSLGNGDNISLKIICSKEFIGEPGPKRLFVHDGWAYGFSGHHILYGINTDLRNVVNVFNKATGSKEGFILNLPIGQNKYLTGLISRNELVEIHIHNRKLWKGVFAGLVGCFLCSEMDLSKVFNTTIDYLGEAVGTGDPIYYFRKYSSEAIEYEEHFKYVGRFLRFFGSYLQKIISDSALLASRPRYSGKIISTKLVKTPINIIAIGPHVLINKNMVKEYLLSNGGALLYLDTKLPGKILDKLRTNDLRIINTDVGTIIWSYNMKKLILSLEKIVIK